MAGALLQKTKDEKDKAQTREFAMRAIGLFLALPSTTLAQVMAKHNIGKGMMG
jgi:hypothetical protein